MALGSRQPKKRTVAEVIQAAAEMDERRQEQIQNQAKIINRLTEINQHYEGVLDEIASNYYEAGTVHEMARVALDSAADISKKHRKEQEDGK